MTIRNQLKTNSHENTQTFYDDYHANRYSFIGIDIVFQHDGRNVLQDCAA